MPARVRSAGRPVLVVRREARHLYQSVMVAGGADELCPSEAAVFDILFATSQRNDNPASSPRPFDRDRDGLVIGEGAGTLVLESLEHAQARGATILAEVVAFATNCDPITGKYPRDPSYDRLLTHIVMRAPAPIGLGKR